MRLVSVRLRASGHRLALHFDDGSTPELEAAYLRVFSPSAEGGSGPARLLPTGKDEVRIVRIENVGRYALRLIFDDGHDSGLYTHETLHRLAIEAPERWAAYRARQARAGGAQKDHP